MVDFGFTARSFARPRFRLYHALYKGAISSLVIVHGATATLKAAGFATAHATGHRSQVVVRPRRLCVRHRLLLQSLRLRSTAHAG